MSPQTGLSAAIIIVWCAHHRAPISRQRRWSTLCNIYAPTCALSRLHTHSTSTCPRESDRMSRFDTFVIGSLGRSLLPIERPVQFSDLHRWFKTGRLHTGQRGLLNEELRSVSNILAGEFVFGNSDRGEISHHHLTIVDLSVGVAWSSQSMVG